MSGMKETIFATVVGGFLTFAGGWAQSHFQKQDALTQERREKLEALMGEAVKLQACIANSADGPDCEGNAAAFRMTSLSYIYFPELKSQVGRYAVEYMRLKNELAKCDSQPDSPEAPDARVTCLSKAERESKLPVDLQSLGTAVEARAAELQ